MCKVTIYTNGHIDVAGSTVKLAVSQLSDRTRVRHRDGSGEITLPHEQYVLSCDNPVSGKPGRASFETDLLSAVGA